MLCLLKIDNESLMVRKLSSSGLSPAGLWREDQNNRPKAMKDNSFRLRAIH